MLDALLPGFALKCEERLLPRLCDWGQLEEVSCDDKLGMQIYNEYRGTCNCTITYTCMPPKGLSVLLFRSCSASFASVSNK